jgi:cysteine-rich repeat protein
MGTARIVAAIAMGAVLFVGSASGKAPDPVKASRNCRKVIGASLSKLAFTGVSVIDACHTARDKGKFTGDCNDLAAADVKQKLAKAEGKTPAAIAKKCLAGDPVLSNYTSDPLTSFTPFLLNQVQGTGTSLLGSPTLAGDKAKIACHKAIAQASAKDIGEIVKGAVKCQNSTDKNAIQFGPLLSDCVLPPSKAGPQGEAAIAKKCTGITGAQVGSCDPLPTCVTATSGTAGQTLAAALYNTIPGCGNTIVEAGEECDDGNHLSTDACIDCKLAKCGDGFVEAGVELCGDSPPDACEHPSEDTCQVTPCTPDGQEKSVVVKFSKPGALNVTGLVIALDYPETEVQIPGTQSAQSVTDRVTVTPSGLPGILDRDYELQVSLAGLDPIAAGDFYSVQFDECSASTIDQFACIVRSASDDAIPPNDVTNQVTCSVVFQ